mmetsp:Transcript_106270/g.266182  ORF Transcript_106270/g.266182 Transcript_106270/m.266182 type:complete len:255 (-) Transcript_106270:407-1171(-)
MVLALAAPSNLLGATPARSAVAPPARHLRVVRRRPRARARARARRGVRRGVRDGAAVAGDAPVRDVGRLLRAMLRARAAGFSVHPIHVRRGPVARHEGHALLQLLEHVLHLPVGVHGLLEGLAALRNCRGDRQAVAVNVEALREGELLRAVDRVTGALAELGRGDLDLRVAPLVALPCGILGVVSCASVVCDLLHVLVALVHVELVAAAQAREALRIAVVVLVFARERDGHVDQVEVDVATAAWAVLTAEVHID